MNRNPKLRRMVLASIFCALIIVMSIVPYTGYISYGIVEITTLHIVVILGAVLLGWVYGAILGFVWGVTCLIRAYVTAIYLPFGFGNPLVSVLPRILVGLFAGLVFAALSKTRLNKTISIILSTLVGVLTNTTLVLSAMNIYCNAFGIDTLKSILMTLVGVNGVIELGAAVVLVPLIYFALQPREKVLGVDIGASATKIALVRGRVVERTLLKTDDETLAEALERFGPCGAARVAVTGVGSDSLTEPILGLPTKHVDEFRALSLGARLLGKQVNCLVASVGTGTSFVRITPFGCWHLGGTGVGGGMLRSLSLRLCRTDSVNELFALAEQGDPAKIDLNLSDVCKGTISNLNPATTVANLYKLTPESAQADTARGLVTLVLQSIGVMSALAVKTHLTRRVVLVGTIMQQRPLTQQILNEVAQLQHVRFLIPDDAAFATAIGAAKA